MKKTSTSINDILEISRQLGSYIKYLKNLEKQ